MLILSLLSLAAFIIHLSIGIYSIQSNRRSAQNISFAILSFALAITSLSFFFLYHPTINDEEYRVWLMISAVAWTFGIPALAHFSISLTGLSKRIPDWVWAVILYGAGIAFYVISVVLIASANEIGRGNNIVMMMHDLSVPFLIAYLVFQVICVLFLTVANLIRWGLNSKNVRERREALTIVVSLLLFYILTYVWDFVDLKTKSGYFSITPVFSLLWSCGILFAINRYRTLSISPSYVAEQIVSNMTDLMVLLDEKMRIIRVNNRVSNILEYNPNELTGNAFLDYVLDSQKNKNDLLEALKANDYGKFTWDVELKSKKGTPVPVRLIAWEVTDRRNLKIGTVLIGHDMRIFHDMEVTNIRIAQALTYLEKSTSDLQHFIYTTSIALKEPLRMIGSFSTLIAHKLDTHPEEIESIKEFQKYVLDGVSRMNDLINALIEYSRIETHAKPFENVDLNVSLKDALGRLSREIDESSARITYDSLPQVMADSMQMEFLLYHLIRNAIHYRKQDVEPVIHVGFENAEKYHIIFVADNGIGIDPSFHNDIFALFRRLNTFQEVPGSGIGLSICKKIVEMHGGNIWVESEPDKGSRFYFTLKETN